MATTPRRAGQAPSTEVLPMTPPMLQACLAADRRSQRRMRVLLLAIIPAYALAGVIAWLNEVADPLRLLVITLAGGSMLAGGLVIFRRREAAWRRLIGQDLREGCYALYRGPVTAERVGGPSGYTYSLELVDSGVRLGRNTGWNDARSIFAALPVATASSKNQRTEAGVAVAFAPRSKVVIEVQGADGTSLYRHPGLAA